jgi:putative phosphoribosyl transferase
MPLSGKRKEEAPPEIVPDPPGWARRSVLINVDPVRLPGELVLPADPEAVVVFAHGSGSSRLSPRNLQVADRLHEAKLGTLLFDLLTPAEAEDRAKVFDIDLLAHRLEGAVRWVWRWPGIGHLPVGLFGASTGAAAALVTASRVREIAAVVSRGGRPDLAGHALERVTCPTLLIVGGNDPEVRELNRAAQRRIHGETKLEVIAGATHLFEEEGALERVAELAAAWFADRVTGSRGGRLSLSDVL